MFSKKYENDSVDFGSDFWFNLNLIKFLFARKLYISIFIDMLLYVPKVVIIYFNGIKFVGDIFFTSDNRAMY